MWIICYGSDEHRRRLRATCKRSVSYVVHYIRDEMQSLLLCGERALGHQHNVVGSMDYSCLAGIITPHNNDVSLILA